MSGQCYLSQYIGGRSANRGECAQPCRKQYDVIDDKGNVIAKDTYPLCLKDFNGSKHLNELVKAGICSFKIEGRLKDVGYVKNIVSYYRSLIPHKSSSGRSIYPFIPNPDKTFNRGFTDYFLNRRGKCFSMESPKSKGEYLGKVVEVKKGCFVIKTNKDIHPQDGLYFNNDGCLINKCEITPPPHPLHQGAGECSITSSSHLPLPQGAGEYNITSSSHLPLPQGAVDSAQNIVIYSNKKTDIKIGTEVYRNIDVEFEKELSKPVKRQIGVEITISDYFEGKDASKTAGEYITLTDEDGVSITVKIPSAEKAKNPEKMKETFVKQFSKTGDGDFYIFDIKIAPETELPFMQVSAVNELRRNLFKQLMQKRLEVYEENRNYQKPLKHVKYFVSEVDYRANVHNSFAKMFYEKCGVSVNEYSLETKVPNRQIELMRCKHCIKYALNMCKSPKKLFLRDSHNKLYPLQFNCNACEMSVLSSD